MSGANFSRRAVLAGGIATVLVASRTWAETRWVEQLIARAESPLGNYRGTHTASSDFSSPIAFLGIRYAEAKRFLAPTEVTVADQIGKADGITVGPVCPQPGNRDD
jgi:carboxylesterase type B